ncbi:MAG: glycogen debranching protein [Williamsia herbipolensis]|nr:glycogen debranching protein [Williamsia herbipolensis]
MSSSVDSVAQAAASVLAGNDRGTRTVAAPRLYPHQWSWDAAFVSIGWATLSVPRALTELRSLLAGQWSSGMIPHIVFSDAPGYFPGLDRWRTDGAPAAPEGVGTSGICQPPVHGLALHVIAGIAATGTPDDRAAVEEFLRDELDRLVLWHRWLGSVRSTHESGLVEIHHGWESGMDNSPRWDGPYSRIVVEQLAPYQRQDLRHVDDPTERPTDLDYDRYIHLVDQLASVHYDDRAARAVIDFRVGDVFVTALHALSAQLLAGLAERIGRTDVVAELTALAAHARAAVAATRDEGTGLARDLDLRTDEWLATETVGGFAELVCGASPERYRALTALLTGPRWCGHPDLAFPLPPSTSPESPAFVAASYWRGPVWPVLTWLLSWCLHHHGQPGAAAALRTAGLQQLGDGRFGEYYHPLDGRALGSDDQSWTAAAALAWAATP